MSLILIFLYNKWNGCVLYSLGSCSTNLCVWLVFQQNAGKGCQSPLWRESVQVIPGYDLIALKDFEYSFEFVHFFLFASWSKFYFLTSFYLLQLLTFILFFEAEYWGLTCTVALCVVDIQVTLKAIFGGQNFIREGHSFSLSTAFELLWFSSQISDLAGPVSWQVSLPCWPIDASNICSKITYFSFLISVSSIVFPGTHPHQKSGRRDGTQTTGVCFVHYHCSPLPTSGRRRIGHGILSFFLLMGTLTFKSNVI